MKKVYQKPEIEIINYGDNDFMTLSCDQPGGHGNHYGWCDPQSEHGNDGNNGHHHGGHH